MKIRGSVAVVTGASSGIGRATALRLARRGADVVLAARRGEALQEVAAQCRRHGVRSLAVPTDVADERAVRVLAERAREEFGRIDVWINNAAVGSFAPFLQTPLADFRRVLDVNVMGYVYGCRQALEQMGAQGAGTVINVASIVGEVPQPYTAPYSMSKAAVRALGVSLRSELRLARARNIHVCTVLPPTIDTPFFQHGANYSGRRALAMPPVYTADAVARQIVRLLGRPRPEAVVGLIGRSLVAQHRLMPRPVEAFMAVQVDRGQLSRREPAAPSPGSIYGPAAVDAAGSVDGGWHGRARTVRRNTLAALLPAAAVAAAAVRRQRRS